jgi:hypothetical protein
MGEAPVSKHVWKLHAPDFNGATLSRGKYTERVVISDNVFRSTGPHDWTVAISPQNAQKDERLRMIVFERNLFLPGPDAVVALIVSAQDVVVRDNIVMHDTGRCFAVSQRGIEPAPARVSLTHNTCYGTGAGALGFLEVDSGLDSITTMNNLLSAVDASATEFPPAAVTEEAGNLVVAPTAFVGSDFEADWNSFALEPGAGAVDQGVSQATSAWDFSGRARSIDGDDSGSAEPDVGALELDP